MTPHFPRKLARACQVFARMGEGTAFHDQYQQTHRLDDTGVVHVDDHQYAPDDWADLYLGDIFEFEEIPTSSEMQ